ncbi:MAG: putative glycosyl hydrolase family 15, partial [Solirubrobacteraceae bacterium]|nr:putative glycosyl hydrolase family 15 [Solirubrobacteraceae bacterium]
MLTDLSVPTETAVAQRPRAGRAVRFAAALAALSAVTVGLLAPAGASATTYANFNRETYLYSSRLSVAQEATSYQVMVLQSTDAAMVPQLKAANPNLKIFVYQAIMAAEDTNSIAMTCTAGPSDLASHPSWILNDQNGNPILNQSQHHYLT